MGLVVHGGIARLFGTPTGRDGACVLVRAWISGQAHGIRRAVCSAKAHGGASNSALRYGDPSGSSRHWKVGAGGGQRPGAIRRRAHRRPLQRGCAAHRSARRRCGAGRGAGGGLSSATGAVLSGPILGSGPTQSRPTAMLFQPSRVMSSSRSVRPSNQGSTAVATTPAVSARIAWGSG